MDHMSIEAYLAEMHEFSVNKRQKVETVADKEREGMMYKLHCNYNRGK
jgi:hypothetical protein